MTKCCENCNNAVFDSKPFLRTQAQFVKACIKDEELEDSDLDDINHLGYCKLFEELDLNKRR